MIEPNPTSSNETSSNETKKSKRSSAKAIAAGLGLAATLLAGCSTAAVGDDVGEKNPTPQTAVEPTEAKDMPKPATDFRCDIERNPETGDFSVNLFEPAFVGTELAAGDRVVGTALITSDSGITISGFNGENWRELDTDKFEPTIAQHSSEFGKVFVRVEGVENESSLEVTGNSSAQIDCTVGHMLSTNEQVDQFVYKQ